MVEDLQQVIAQAVSEYNRGVHQGASPGLFSRGIDNASKPRWTLLLRRQLGLGNRRFSAKDQWAHNGTKVNRTRSSNITIPVSTARSKVAPPRYGSNRLAARIFARSALKSARRAATFSAVESACASARCGSGSMAHALTGSSRS